jgi:hypothetical protein
MICILGKTSLRWIIQSVGCQGDSFFLTNLEPWRLVIDAGSVNAWHDQKGKKGKAYSILGRFLSSDIKDRLALFRLTVEQRAGWLALGFILELLLVQHGGPESPRCV